jgi:hypothetical protein
VALSVPPPLGDWVIVAALWEPSPNRRSAACVSAIPASVKAPVNVVRSRRREQLMEDAELVSEANTVLSFKTR